MCVKQAKRFAIYLVGLMILTCGQRLFVQAGLGAGAFDSLCVGVSQYNSISAGTWVTIGSFILMLVSAALEKRRPDGWVILSSFVFGIFFDMWGAVFAATLPSELTLIQQILLYIVGLMLAPLGTQSISRQTFPKVHMMKLSRSSQCVSLAGLGLQECNRGGHVDFVTFSPRAGRSDNGCDSFCIRPGTAKVIWSF